MFNIDATEDPQQNDDIDFHLFLHTRRRPLPHLKCLLMYSVPLEQI